MIFRLSAPREPLRGDAGHRAARPGSGARQGSAFAANAAAAAANVARLPIGRVSGARGGLSPRATSPPPDPVEPA
ncbi:hypothetical protein WMF04_15610 [Sorangium sp. So ce260]|uniref:hypothetical protein n=1 Tax=Sorangium sp. So ce260 TaxID=3133291 RepID=UPI003F60F6FB